MLEYSLIQQLHILSNFTYSKDEYARSTITTLLIPELEGVGGSQEAACVSITREHKQTPCIHTRTDCAHEAVSRGANGTRDK